MQIPPVNPTNTLKLFKNAPSKQKTLIVFLLVFQTISLTSIVFVAPEHKTTTIAISGIIFLILLYSYTKLISNKLIKNDEESYESEKTSNLKAGEINLNNSTVDDISSGIDIEATEYIANLNKTTVGNVTIKKSTAKNINSSVKIK